MNKKDVRLVSLAAISGIQRYALPLMGGVMVLGWRINSALSESNAVTLEIVAMLALVALLIVGIFVLGFVALRRRLAIQALLKTPNQLARIEQYGRVVRIVKSDGGLIEFSVKPNWYNPTTAKKVNEALRRIAPHAMAASTGA